MIGPSQVVVPVYAEAIRPAATSVVVADIVRPQNGVRSPPPLGKSSLNESAVAYRDAGTHGCQTERAQMRIATTIANNINPSGSA